MLNQAKFAKCIDAENPDYRNFDDKNAEVDVKKTNPLITCPLCSGNFVFLTNNILKTRLQLFHNVCCIVFAVFFCFSDWLLVLMFIFS